MYTTNGWAVVRFARGCSGSPPTGLTSTERILRCILIADRCRACGLLEEHGVSRADVRRELEDRKRRGTSGYDGAVKVEEHARREAKAMGHTLVGTGHLLLGLLAVEESEASRMLRQRGLRLDELRNAVRTVAEYSS